MNQSFPITLSSACEALNTQDACLNIPDRMSRGLAAMTKLNVYNTTEAVGWRAIDTSGEGQPLRRYGGQRDADNTINCALTDTDQQVEESARAQQKMMQYNAIQEIYF